MILAVLDAAGISDFSVSCEFTCVETPLGWIDPG